MKFDSDTHIVDLYHEPLSYEIGLCISRRDATPDGVNYSMAEIARFFEPLEAAGYRDYMAFTTDSVSKGVLFLATRLHRYIDAGLFEKPGPLDQLDRLRAESIRQDCQEEAINRMRRLLEQAWRAQEFARVVELLEPHMHELNREESMKLAYAAKRVAGKE